MNSEILSFISSLLVAFISFMGIVYSNAQSSKRVENQLTTAQAVTENKLTTLTRAVERHNDFGRQIPLMEHEINELKKQLDEIKKSQK
jgi:septal ring factor EnvC (AmiA/AmiB activator)